MSITNKKAILTDCGMPRASKASLAARGYNIITLPPFEKSAPPVASHPDMLVFILKDRLFVSEEYMKNPFADKAVSLFAALAELRVIKTKRTPRRDYPDDVLFNAAIVGKYIFAHKNALTSEIREAAEELEYNIINVKQGYAKCSTCIVSDNAIITADRNIVLKAKELAIDTLLIGAGSVILEGYDSGFIGGASGRTASEGTDTVFFCGDISTHPDGCAIERFCRLHSVRPVSLSNEPLHDVGTMFFA